MKKMDCILCKFRESMNKRCIFACIMIFFVVMIAGCYSYTAKYKTDYKKPAPSNPVVTKQNDKKQEKSESHSFAKYPFEITMLDVGQGLCVLIRENDEYMVYDGGGGDSSRRVVSIVSGAKNIKSLRYMFASHYDQDHISGLIGLLNRVTVGMAIIPGYQEKTKTYFSFKRALEKARSVVYANSGQRYKLGNANIDILYATNGKEEKENDRSTVIKVSYGNFSCIITGDAEAETEAKLVKDSANLSCDLYIVGHHGSSTSSTPDFVAAMKPKLAFISVGKDNKFGHPSEKTLKTLENNSTKIYRSDTQGDIVLAYDGKEYSIITSKNEEPLAKSATNENLEQDYVLNIKRMKYHRKNCRNVESISDKNRKFVHSSKKALENEGYSPCGYCQP